MARWLDGSIRLTQLSFAERLCVQVQSCFCIPSIILIRARDVPIVREITIIFVSYYYYVTFVPRVSETRHCLIQIDHR